jgi:hypothetical protein
MSRLREFIQVYRLYRQRHGRRYSLRIAWGCSFRQLPF